MKSLITITLIYLFSIGNEAIDGNRLNNPQSISVDIEGNLYIADTDNNRILKLKVDGTPLTIVGGFGWGKEQFDTPLDICAKSLLDVFIADFNNQRIERYDKDLNYISSLYPSDSGDPNMTFGYPSAVSISQHGELIIIDSDNNRLIKINSFGESELSFGDFAGGSGKLDDPAQIDINSKDMIYVTDRAAGKIICYDYFGNYLCELGTSVLAKPYGIFIDNEDMIWISDVTLKEIFIFSSYGDLHGRTNRIDIYNSFINPKDIVVIKNRVFVLDENKVHVFKIHISQ
ncbi:NHL repeat-containing protein [candidate division KSB1 bacterium]|nr:NHL repeat-containing protein [candidate division KSB1 bacterium]